MKKVKLRNVKLLAQGHTASKQCTRLGLRSANAKTLVIYKADWVLVISAGFRAQQVWVQILALPHTNQ